MTTTTPSALTTAKPRIVAFLEQLDERLAAVGYSHAQRLEIAGILMSSKVEEAAHIDAKLTAASPAVPDEQLPLCDSALRAEPAGQREITRDDYVLVRAAAKDLFNKSFADKEVQVSSNSEVKRDAVVAAITVFQEVMKVTPAPDDQSIIAGSARQGGNTSDNSNFFAAQEPAPATQQDDRLEFFRALEDFRESSQDQEAGQRFADAVLERAATQQAEPVGYLYGEEFYHVGNPELSDHIRNEGRKLYAAPVSPSPSEQEQQEQQNQASDERGVLHKVLEWAELRESEGARFFNRTRICDIEEIVKVVVAACRKPSGVLVKCGGDGISNASCASPKHRILKSGATYCDWTCVNCGGTGRTTWD